MRETNAGAINKPMLMLGMDKRAIALAFIAGGVFAAMNQGLLGGLAFVSLVWAGTKLAKNDPKILEIGSKLLGQPGLYDPAKRVQPTLVIERRTNGNG